MALKPEAADETASASEQVHIFWNDDPWGRNWATQLMSKFGIDATSLLVSAFKRMRYADSREDLKQIAALASAIR